MCKEVKISVIVPVYNGEKYLEKCINSIASQSYENLDIVLVDDGSTDRSGHICDTCQYKDSRVQVIHKKNGGLVSARKAGIREALGEFVISVDADDWIEPDYIENMVRAQREANADIVAANLFFDIGDDSRVVYNGIPYGTYTPEQIGPSMLYDGTFFQYGINPHLVTKLGRRDIILKSQLDVDESIVGGEDAAVTYPALVKAQKICIANVCGYHYIQRPDSMTKTVSSNELERIEVLIGYLKSKFQDMPEKMQLKRQICLYEKYLKVLRNIASLDDKEDIWLLPFGGICPDTRIVLYGAGGVGQQIYRYLTKTAKPQIVMWLDRNYQAYQKNGMDVRKPLDIKTISEKYDCVIIANIDAKIAGLIKDDLIHIGVEPQKIRWFTEEFLGN